MPKTWIESHFSGNTDKSNDVSCHIKFQWLFILLQVLSIRDETFTFSQRHLEEALSIFTMAKKPNIVEKKKQKEI